MIRVKSENITKRIRCALLILLAMILAFVPSGLVYAALPDEATLDMYNANGIYYYNPNGGDDCGPGSVGLVDGEGNAAYVWNWFAQAGIAGVSDNPAVIAGIMGNLNAESSMDPFEHDPSSNYYGIHQALNKPGYDPGMYQIIADNGWLQYLNFDHSSSSPAPPDVVEKALDLQLTHMTVENIRFTKDEPGSWKESFLNNLEMVSEKTPEAYAELFEVAVEGAEGLGHNGDGYIQDPGVIAYTAKYWRGQTAYQDVGKRRKFAREFYDQFANSTTNFLTTSGSGLNVDAEGWVTNIQGLQKEEANLALTDDIIYEKYATSNGKPNAIVLHYTAGLTAGLAAYGGNYYPAHFTIDLKNKIGYQHFSLDHPSLAVGGGRDPVKGTPAYDAYVVQIEIVGCGYSGAGSAVDVGCMKANGGYSLDQLQPEDWDYLAYYLNAISAYTGIPLTTSVIWDETREKLSDAEMREYKGVLGHMHVPSNDKVDPGNIWPDVEAALKRNPSSSYNVACIPGSGYGLVSGGMTLEQARNFMKQYRDMADPTVYYSEGSTVTIGGTGITALNVGCTGAINNQNFLNNCPVVPYWFINAYTTQKINTYKDGAAMARYVANNIDGATLAIGQPKVYSVFSRLQGYGAYVESGHTGIVLGIDVDRDVIIVGEAGCGEYSESMPNANEKSLSEFSTDMYEYAVLDSILVGL